MGSITLLRRAASAGSAPTRSARRGIDTAALAERLEADAAAVEDGTLVPGPEATADPPAV